MGYDWLGNILIAIFAYTYVNVLATDGMIFCWLDKLLSNLPDWLYKPLGGCDVCFGGQLALWYYLFTTGAYDPIQHIFFTTTTIFIIHILKNGIKKT